MPDTQQASDWDRSCCPVWPKYWSEALAPSIENLICVDHCPSSASESRSITLAKVYGNCLVRSPVVIVINNASALALVQCGIEALHPFEDEPWSFKRSTLQAKAAKRLVNCVRGRHTTPRDEKIETNIYLHL
jgi:hypothetical protein